MKLLKNILVLIGDLIAILLTFVIIGGAISAVIFFPVAVVVGYVVLIRFTWHWL